MSVGCCALTAPQIRHEEKDLFVTTLRSGTVRGQHPTQH
ncbi:hypothetical protein MNB_SV-10-1545 [hydrothermal vent metagenome]|uniref:Uncharacterized protein n=1 Tax=hydrothermal vent metagenome TaxID=652676 RepID=A0A1W1CT60_9ZZZZ